MHVNLKSFKHFVLNTESQYKVGRQIDYTHWSRGGGCTKCNLFWIKVKEMFYFFQLLNTLLFTIIWGRTYGKWDNERGNPLSLILGLLFPINNKGNTAPSKQESAYHGLCYTSCWTMDEKPLMDRPHHWTAYRFYRGLRPRNTRTTPCLTCTCPFVATHIAKC